MNTLVLDAVKASPYGADPVGTKRPFTDFRSQTDPDKLLDGYMRDPGNPIANMLGLPRFNDARDEIVGDRKVMVVLVNADDDDVISGETWAAFWHEDGNEPDDAGKLDAADVTITRIA